MSFFNTTELIVDTQGGGWNRLLLIYIRNNRGVKKKTRFEILLSAMHCCRLLDKNSVILFNQFRENSRYAIHILLS